MLNHWEYVVKSMASTWLLSLVFAWASVASAQSTAVDPFAECPSLPSETNETLRWEVVRPPGMLFCRAINTTDGAEAFALTVSRESPFRPRRTNRAESAVLNGREVWWYRGELPNQPSLLIREMLIRFAENGVIHLSLRANNAETLAQHQQLVLSLALPAPIDD
jgi:hypothetical protein